MYWPGNNLIFKLASPASLVVFVYNTPLILNFTVWLANTLPCPSNVFGTKLFIFDRKSFLGRWFLKFRLQ